MTALSVIKDMIDVPCYIGPEKKIAYDVPNQMVKNGNVAMAFAWVPDMATTFGPIIADKVKCDLSRQLKPLTNVSTR